MEFLLLALVAIGFIFSGPIAFIWCCILSSRLSKLEEENFKLQSQLYRLQRDPGPVVTKTEPPILSSSSRNEAKRRDEEPTKSESQPVKSEPPTVWSQPIPLHEKKPDEKRPEPAQPPKLEQPVVAAASIFSDIPKPPPVLPTPPKPQAVPSRPMNDRQWDKTTTPKPKDGEFSWQSLELLIGRKILGWVAVLGFILAATLFILHAVQEGWIGRMPPVLKVFCVASFGAAFLGAGKYFARIGWRRFSTMLSSAGVVIVFQAGYATYAFYELISLSAGGVVMSLIVLGSFLLSWHYNSKLLGMISIVGGLAVPLLLSSDVDRYPEFFTYLIILNIGTVMLVNLLRRAPIAWLAFFGTQAEFWLWHSQHYVHPDKLTAALIFQACFYVVYLIDTTIASTTKRRGRQVPANAWDDIVRAILAPIVFFGTIWHLLHEDPVFGPWLGVVAFIGAAWYALLAVVYAKHLDRIWNTESDQKLSAYWKAGPTAATVISLGFVAIAIPLQFDALWIALGWTTVFAGLWYFGNRQENKTFIVLSCIFAVMGMGRWIYDVSHCGASEAELSVPLFNVYALPLFTVGLVAIIVSVLTHRLLKTNDETSRDENTSHDVNTSRDLWSRSERCLLNFTVGLAGYFIAAIIFSIESWRFFQLRPEFYAPIDHCSSMSLTVLWSVLAWILWETGIRFRSADMRKVATTGFYVVAAKMLFFDFPLRGQCNVPFENPFLPALVFTSFVLMGVAVQSRLGKRCDETERTANGVLGIIGIFTLLGIFSAECYHFVFRFPEQIPLWPYIALYILHGGEWASRILAFNTLTVLWTAYALLLLVLGFLFRATPLRFCALFILAGTFCKIASFDVWSRSDYAMTFCNPYFLSILCPVTVVSAFAIWTLRIRPMMFSKRLGEREIYRALGIVGLFFFWVSLSVEIFSLVYKNPLGFSMEDIVVRNFIATASLSIFWSVAAALSVAAGIKSRSPYLRYFGLFVSSVLACKIIGMELMNRPAFEIPLLNPYFVTIIFASVVMIATAVWTTRSRPLENVQERWGFLSFGLLGIIFVWFAASVECFQYFDIRTDWPNHRFLASASLTVFWTVLAIALAVVAATAKSRPLRILSVGMLILTLLKVLAFDLFERPLYATPFLNPFALPLGIFAFTLIFISVSLISFLDEKEDWAEREAYHWIALAGVVFLWSVLSLECFQSVRLLQGAESEAWKAQTALSILWSVFAGVLIFVGFRWQSAILRWMAILLFAVTITKVLIVDLSGVDQLYRFGAVFVLAVFLSLAAWAYQRFRPEKIE